MGSEESNGPPPRFSKGLISIKYKKSPIRLVSPPIPKKLGDSTCEPKMIKDDQTYFTAPTRFKDTKNGYYSAEPGAVSRNDGNSQSCLMTVS